MDEITKILDLWASRFLSGGTSTFVPQIVTEKLLLALKQAKGNITGDIDPILEKLMAMEKEEDGFEIRLDNDLNRKLLTLLMANRAKMSAFGQSLLDNVCGRFKAT